MGRRKAKTALITFLITFLVVGLIAALICYKMVTTKQAQINQLLEERADVQCYAFSKDLLANTIITPDDITKIDYKSSSQTSGMYLVSGAGPWMDASGVPHEYATHYIKTVDSYGTENVSEMDVLVDDAIVGRMVKANVSKNTPVLDSNLYVRDEEQPAKDLRIQEFNFIQIPSDVNTGDFVDVRIQFPTGENYRVVTAKRVEKAHMEENDGVGQNTIFLNLNEEETLTMASAVIEAYMQDGVKLYASKYVDPANQLFREEIVDYVEKYKEGLASAILSEEFNRIQQMYSASGDFYLTLEDYINQTEQERSTWKEGIIPVREEDISNDVIAIFAGIKVEHVKAIRDALKQEGTSSAADVAEGEYASSNTGNQNVLNFYRAMRVKTKLEVKPTYPVKEEVLTVLRNNPDIISEVYASYEQLFNANISRYDEYRRLLKEYDEAPETKDYSRENQKTKSEIMQEITKLIEDRASKVSENVEKEINQQRSDRVAYLSQLLGISVGE